MKSTTATDVTVDDSIAREFRNDQDDVAAHVAPWSDRWDEFGWDKAAIGMALYTAVVRVHHLMNSRGEQVLRPHGLSFTRYQTLMLLLLSEDGGVPLGRIGEHLHIRPGAVTSVVDRLEAEGLVRREAHPTDRRTTLAALTAAGRTKAIGVTDMVNPLVFQDIDLTDDDFTSLFALLERLRVACVRALAIPEEGRELPH